MKLRTHEQRTATEKPPWNSQQKQLHWKHVSEDTEEMTQSRSNAFPRHKRRNNKINATYETTDSRTKKTCNRETAFEQSIDTTVLKTCKWRYPRNVTITKQGLSKAQKKKRMTKQTPHMKPQTHEQRTATKEPPWTNQQKQLHWKHISEDTEEMTHSRSNAFPEA